MGKQVTLNESWDYVGSVKKRLPYKNCTVGQWFLSLTTVTWADLSLRKINLVVDSVISSVFELFILRGNVPPFAVIS